MNPRTTLVLLVVALVLGGVVWLSNREQSEQAAAEAAAKRLFPDLEASDIEWIALRTSDEREARLARRDGVWRVVEPVDFPADVATADGLASALATLESEAVIEEPQALAVYGLGDDARVVRFGANGEDHVLRLGKKTPVGANSYASTGAGETVYTVPTFRTTGFDRPLDDLRERRPLRFDRDAVVRIEASWPDGGVVLEKQDEAWRLVEPLAEEADGETVETLLSDLVFLRAAGFVDDPPPDAEVGLDEPQYRVVLEGAAPESGGEPPRWELAIGGVVATNARAGRAAEAALYHIPEDRFQKLPKTIEAFRFKELSDFLASDARRFELVFHDTGAEAQSRAVTITGERDDDGWTTIPEPMAPGRAAALVAQLARLRAEGIAAEEAGPDELAALGLAPPRVAIRVYGEAPEGGEAPLLADVQLGVQKDGAIFARRGDRDTIFRVDAVLAEQVPISLEAFENRFRAEPEPESEGDAEAAEPTAEAAPEETDADGGAAGEAAAEEPSAEDAPAP